jgi:hypothetical protein
VTPEHLNGAQLYRRGNTIFVPLPRSQWRPSGNCCCQRCSPDGKGRPAYWDTLAIAEDPKKMKGGNDVTWLVHAPEYHGVGVKREVW